MKLSENFSLKEMVKSDTATRLGIENTPREYAIENLRNLCVNVLQPARDELGPIKINSGYRSVELCEAIGSSARSNHTRGQAADAESWNIPNFELLLWIYNNCEFKELIAEYFDPDDGTAGWVHVAYEEGNNKRDLKLKDPTHHYERVGIEEIIELYA